MLPGLIRRLWGLHCKYYSRAFPVTLLFMPLFQNKQFSQEGFNETFNNNFPIFVFSLQSYIHPRIANFPWLGTFPSNTFNQRAISYFRSHLLALCLSSWSWSQYNISFIKRKKGKKKKKKKKRRKKKQMINGFGFGLMKRILQMFAACPKILRSSFLN